MHKKKVILFDLDGTLLNTSVDLQKALHSVQTTFGCALSSLEQVENSMGHGIKALVLKNMDAGLSSTEALHLFNQAYALGYNQGTLPYLGIREGLLELKKMGYRLGVVSNKEDEYTQALIQTHFPTIFDFVLGAKIELPKKPNPRMLSEALSALACSAEEAIYVGDTEVDYESAKAAKMDCLLVAYGYRSYDQLKELDALLVESVMDCFKSLSCV